MCKKSITPCISQTSQDLKILLPENFNHECIFCGTCCKGWRIEVDEKTYANLINTEFYKKSLQDSGLDEIICTDEENQKQYFTKIDKDCIMLHNNLCTLHNELGEKKKPLVCRAYPMQFTLTPDGIYLGLSFVCPAIRENLGTPIEDQITHIEELCESIPLEMLGEGNIRIADKAYVEWEGYRIIEKYLWESLEKNGLDLGSWLAMCHTASLVHLYNNDEKIVISSKKIEEFLANPPFIPVERDEGFFEYQIQLASSIIQTLELWEDFSKEEYQGIVLNGGSWLSQTLKAEIKAPPAAQWMESSTASDFYEELYRYTNMLIWHKFLIKGHSILSQICALNLIPKLFSWYSYACASIEGRETPIKKDSLKALGIIELHLEHSLHLHGFFNLFAEGVMMQTMPFD